MADRIAVIEGGDVKEQGAHQQLIDRGGQYAHLRNASRQQEVKRSEAGLQNVPC